MGRTIIGPGARLALACAVLFLPACGGDSPTAPPPTTLPPPPPAPVVVAQGSGALPAEDIRFVQFTTTAAGRLDITVDWTFASNDVDFALVRGLCDGEDLLDGTCPPLGLTESVTAKPERLSIAGATAGQYTLFFANFGDRDDSIAYQVLLAAGAASASASSVPGNASLRLKRPVRGTGPLR
jgi:hypothetical protein